MGGEGARDHRDPRRGGDAGDREVPVRAHHLECADRGEEEGGGDALPEQLHSRIAFVDILEHTGDEEPAVELGGVGPNRSLAARPARDIVEGLRSEHALGCGLESLGGDGDPRRMTRKPGQIDLHLPGRAKSTVILGHPESHGHVGEIRDVGRPKARPVFEGTFRRRSRVHRARGKGAPPSQAGRLRPMPERSVSPTTIRANPTSSHHSNGSPKSSVPMVRAATGFT